MNIDVSPYILKFKFFFKNTFSTMTAWIHVGILQSKTIPFQTGLANYYSWKHNTYSRYVLLS